ncbi:MAG: XrtA system polysaccharide deacetylase, partial [Thermoanaerobaculia bacterium]
MVNALSFDVEDYFQVSAFEGRVRREEWESYPSRVAQNTRRLLDILEAAGTRATFFVLGWVAER